MRHVAEDPSCAPSRSLNPDELSTLSEYLQRIIDNTDTRLLDEEITERRKAIHEFLMLDRSGTEAQE